MAVRILVVDDDSLVRDGVSLLIQRELTDAEVVHAAGASEAIQLLGAGNIDLVLTDVAMERRDAGWEVAEHARAQGIAVILVSEQRASASVGRALSVPLLRRWELARVLADAVECALASQRGRVEFVACRRASADGSFQPSSLAKTKRALTSDESERPYPVKSCIKS